MAEADHQAGRWQLNHPGATGTLLELYRHCGAPPTHRATVPVLMDPGATTRQRKRPTGRAAQPWPTAEEAPELAPEDLKAPIAAWQDLLQPAVNDGVYRCGFARNQAAYDRAENALFAALDEVEHSLSTRGPWLCGDRLTLADLRLFPTLIRWETVYSPLFGCSRRQLWQFPRIWQWRQKLFTLPGVQASCNAQAWKHDYFGALFPLNPGGIVPAAPDLSTLVNSSVPTP